MEKADPSSLGDEKKKEVTLSFAGGEAKKEVARSRWTWAQEMIGAYAAEVRYGVFGQQGEGEEAASSSAGEEEKEEAARCKRGEEGGGVVVRNRGGGEGGLLESHLPRAISREPSPESHLSRAIS